SGQFTISGSGADIWGTADAFQFVYTYVPVSTNCDIRARVASVPSTHSNAKAAVMIRETLAANSRHALVDVQPSAGIEFLFRTNTGGSSYVASVSGQTAPNWVRLTRTNNTFTAYWSPDGVAWNPIGAPTSIAMAGPGAYVGLAVCSHNNAVLNTSVIDRLSLTPPPPVVLQTAGAFTNGQFGLNFLGMAGQRYVLLSSTNLLNWTPVQTNNTTEDGPVGFTDLAATNTAKFYRVQQP
ncbi:MAG TPA: hypothetical protein VFV81_03555, partial [Verrucomicrobiae bacterium]|nr:hypothetical protein [Verrucomicrobiae bacterium]